jgi:hypothetical protein
MRKEPVTVATHFKKIFKRLVKGKRANFRLCVSILLAVPKEAPFALTIE